MTSQPVLLRITIIFFALLSCSLFTQVSAQQCLADDITLECSDAGNPDQLVAWNNDNISGLMACAELGCDAVTVTSDFTTDHFIIACGVAGTITVVYTVEGCNETVEVSATASVDDTTQPIASCNPMNQTTGCESSNNMAAIADAWNAQNIALLEACSSDDCSAQITVSSNYNSSSITCDADINVEYNVTDDCGNVTSATATFTVMGSGTDDGGTDDGGTDDGGTDDGGTDDGGTDDGGTDDGGTDDGGTDDGGANNGCGAVGGVFITLHTDTTEVTVCVGDEISDVVFAKVWEEEGDGSVYIVTDENGMILSLTNDIKFQFEGTPVGTNFIYHVSTVGDVRGLSEGSNISDITGCHELSNAIRVNKIDDGDQCGCAMSVSLGQPRAICLGEEIILNAEVLNSNVCTIVCEIENSGTLVEWDMDACHSITDGVSNKDFSELAPSYPSPDNCVNVTATPVNVEGGMHSCTIPKEGLGGRAMCFSGSKKCYWRDDSPDALKFSVTLTPEQSSTITGLQFYESAPERFRWYNPDFSEHVEEGPNNHPRFYGLRVTRNGEEIFQENDIPTTQDWTLEEFDFNGNDGFRVEETTTFEFELLGYCPAWNNAITYAWDLDNIKLLGGCCEKDTVITAVDYAWSTGDTGESITVSPTEHTEYSVTVTDCMGCVAEHTVPVAVNQPVTADLGGDITVCREDLPITISHSIEGIDTKHPRVEWSTGEVGESIEITEAGTYMVTVTDGIACSDTDEITVIIADPTPVNFPDNIAPLCSGSTLELSTIEPGSQSGGTWTNNNGEVVTNVGAGTYTYTFTDGEGCDVSADVTITEDNFSFTIDDQGPICSDATFDFSGIVPSGVDGDRWSVDDLGGGNFRFTGTNSNGCTASDEFNVSVDNFSIQLDEPAILCEGEVIPLTTQEPNNFRGGIWTDGNGNTVEDGTPGTFTYTVTNDNGCVASDDITFRGSDFMIMEIADDSVCWGDSLLLADLEFPEQSGGIWKDLNGEVVTYGEQDTRYRYHFFDDRNGCTHIVDVHIHEKHCDNVDPCAGYTIRVGDPADLCVDETIDLSTLEINEFVGGTWTNGNGEEVTAGGPGNYTYTFINEAGCVASMNVIIFEKDCTDPCENFSVEIEDPDSICDDSTIDLSGLIPAGAEGGQWTDSDGNGVTVVGPGAYRYSVVTPAGCSAIVTITVPGMDCAVDPCDDHVASIDLGGNRTLCEDEFPLVVDLGLTCEETVTVTSNDGSVQLDGDAISFEANVQYEVTITDANGNSATESILLTSMDCSDPATPCDDGNPNTENDIQIDDCSCCGTPIAGQVIYVDSDATGSNDGSSWADAYTDLQDAMMTAQAGQEIWVADGTYIPTQDGNREIYFNMPSGVSLYGGFVGTETNICQRDFTSTRTILSGDLAGDDKAHSTNLLPLDLLFENTEENSNFVIRNSQVTDDITIDGIAITGGVANVTDNAGGGGILFVAETDATIELTNVLLVQNQGAGLGGAVRINTRFETTLNVKMDRVIFLQNRTQGPALSKGGGLYLGGFNGGFIDAEITNSVFAQNHAENRGGAVTTDENVRTMYTNCLFTGNRASDGGAVFENNGDNEAIHTNNTFYLNHADITGGAIVNFGDFGSNTVESRNCIYFGNVTLAMGGPAFDNFNSSSNNFSIQNCLFSEAVLAMLEAEAPGMDDRGGNLFAVADPMFTDPLNADFTLQSGSPAVNAGDNGFVSLSEDLAGNERIQGGTVDMGALESGENGACFTDIFELAGAGFTQPDQEVYESLVSEQEEPNIEALAEVVTYPNPTTELINVIVKKYQSEDEVSMRLFDVSGNALPSNYNVVNDLGEQVEYSVPVNNFKGGVYILKVKTGRFTFNKRVIVINN